MKKILFSTKSSKNIRDYGVLLLRLAFGGLMIPAHGYAKLKNFEELSETFTQFMGLSSTLSLSMAIFSEFFCAILLIIGLMTRLATIPLILTMVVALNTAVEWDFIGKSHGELAFAFLIAYTAILIMGPGKHSIDNMINKNTK